MNFLDKFTKKVTSTASDAVKTEVKKTAFDLIPKIVSLAAMLLGMAMFKEVVDEPEDISPSITKTTFTTNNYFFQNMSEDTVKKILEGK